LKTLSKILPYFLSKKRFLKLFLKQINQKFFEYFFLKSNMRRYDDDAMDNLAHGYTRGIPDFPDHFGYAVIESKLPQRYGKRMSILVDTDEYKRLPVMLKDIPIHLQRYIPQDDPRWLEMRKKARITGSVSAELLGFHDKSAANLLHLPDMMIRKPQSLPFNEKWDDIRYRFKYGELPRTPMDPPGNVNCAQGKVKEANALAYIMDSVPSMQFREMGAVEITEDQLMHFNLINVFKNSERITSFPDKFRIVISPDGDVTAPAHAVYIDGSGYAFSSEMEDFALELKYPTFFGPKGGQFKGFDFYPKGEKGCKIYPSPKTYYLPQVFLEMLALKRHKALFGCATYASGMRIWKIDMDEEYLSLILSVLILLHEKFIMNDQPVPTDYFFERYTPDAYKRRCYERLLDMTNEISDTAKEYMFISGADTKRITSEIGVVNTNTFVRFPNLYEDVVPLHQLLCIYGRRLMLYFETLKWTESYLDFEKRQCNMQFLLDTSMTSFALPIAEDIYATVRNQLCGQFPEDSEIRGLDVIYNTILEAMEKFILHVLKLIFELYGSPAFGYDKDLDLLLFDENIRARAAAISDKYFITNPYVFSSEWIDELVSIDDIWVNKFSVSSINVYKETLMDNAIYNTNNEDENLQEPLDWQYHRLIAVLSLINTF
jgi:hypothetical protein